MAQTLFKTGFENGNPAKKSGRSNKPSEKLVNSKLPLS